MHVPVRALAATGLVLTALAAAPVPAAHSARQNEVYAYDTALSEASEIPIAQITVRLDRKPKAPVTVSWRTVDGTAKKGSDYRAGSGQVRFRPGQRVARFNVPIIDDLRPEGTEYFSVRLSSRAVRVKTPMVDVLVNDDDTGPYGGEIVATLRTELQANDFHTLETWTMTLVPHLRATQQGTAWYDDARGTWKLTGTRTVEDDRPEATCPTLSETVYSGEGGFFVEPRPDSDASGRNGNLVLQSFFPQHPGNLGLEPTLHVVVPATISETSYGPDCEESHTNREELVTLPDLVGDVELTSHGAHVLFLEHVVRDDSTETEIDTYQLDVIGTLGPVD